MAYIIPANKGGLGMDSLEECLGYLDQTYTITKYLSNDGIESLPITDTVQTSFNIDTVEERNDRTGVIVRIETDDAGGNPVNLTTTHTVVRTYIYKTKGIAKPEPVKVRYSNTGSAIPISATEYFIPISDYSQTELQALLDDTIAQGYAVNARYIVERIY